MTKYKLEAAHYKACLMAVKTLCEHELAERNPTAAIDAMKEFIQNSEYNKPLAQKE